MIEKNPWRKYQIFSLAIARSKSLQFQWFFNRIFIFFCTISKYVACSFFFCTTNKITRKRKKNLWRPKSSSDKTQTKMPIEFVFTWNQFSIEYFSGFIALGDTTTTRQREKKHRANEKQNQMKYTNARKMQTNPIW